MKLQKEMALVEAILFLENGPLKKKKLAELTGFTVETLDVIVHQLQQSYLENEQRGLMLLEEESTLTLTPKRSLTTWLIPLYGKKGHEKLSKAAMETLAIIAYSQPVTQTEISSIRGISAEKMINFLIGKELIKVVGKKKAPGRPFQYGTTETFLKLFHLTSISELPALSELDKKRFVLD